jgi:hypothetical protein
LLNTYREAVRARVLHGLFALALATAAYALIVGQYASKNTLRAISDIGAFGISFYGVVVAIVLGATSLHREVELKTAYPILAKPLSRGQYLVGKVLGIWLTLAVFMCANAGVLLLALHSMTAKATWHGPALLVGLTALCLALGRRFERSGTYLPILWSLLLVTCAWALATDAPDDRRVVVGSAILALFEVGLVTALAMLFSAFSSPFLTALFTFAVFVVGRSADTLATLPKRVFGEFIPELGAVLARAFPNLMLYVPARPLLTGEASEQALGAYVLLAGVHTAAWVVGLVLVATWIFQRRDFV